VGGVRDIRRDGAGPGHMRWGREARVWRYVRIRDMKPGAWSIRRHEAAQRDLGHGVEG